MASKTLGSLCIGVPSSKVGAQPDVLQDGLDVVVVGTAAGRTSAERRQYYAGPGNRFWPTLHAVGFMPRRLAPSEFQSLPSYGLGLTDLNKTQAGMDKDIGEYDLRGFRAKILQHKPKVVAFNGKKAAAVFLQRPTREISYGKQAEQIGVSEVWVLPNTSGAASRYWDESYWHALHRQVRRSKD